MLPMLPSHAVPESPFSMQFNIIQYNSILKSSTVTLVGSGGVHGDLRNVLVFGAKDVVLAFGDPEIVVIRQSSISIAYQFSKAIPYL